MITSTSGNAWLITTQPVAARERRLRKRARAYAIGVASRIASSAETAAASRLLAAAADSGCWANACRKFSRVGASGIQVGCMEPSSRGGLKAVESSHRKGKARKTR